jgi:hypothetical protein
MIKTYKTQIHEKFTEMSKSGKLFRVALSGHAVWDLYLASFSSEDDPIFRDPESSVHNCNHCNNFIRRYGNIVSIDENFKMVTMFDVDVQEEEYRNTAKVLTEAILASKISEVFFETFDSLNKLPYESCSKSNSVYRLGTDKNVKRYTREEAEKFGVVKPNEIRTFNHFYLDVPKTFVSTNGDSTETIMASYRAAKEVFQRGMEEISLDTLVLVKDLIIQGSLLDGQTHLYKVEEFIPLKEKYNSLPKEDQNNWCWAISYKYKLAKFKGELIGTLCSELSEGAELNKACQDWNRRVDPANYMKVTAPITGRQIEEAKKFVEENDYIESFDRRFANMNDIKVSEILHSNIGKDEIKTVSIFDGVKSTSTRHKRNEFEGVEEVSIEKFMKDILPTCTSVEAFLTNAQSGNMVSLTTANNPDSKGIFKWNNNYSWTFNGNLAGKSQIKEAVKLAGGNVEGILNFRLAWNDGDGKDQSDLDAWATEPNGKRIGFSTDFRSSRGNRSPMSGQLDVDNTNPGGKLAVENITWINKNKMGDGVYKLWVNQYSSRNSQGFKAEIEFGGDVYTYSYDKAVSNNVNVAEITLKNGEFTIKHLLPETTASRDIYGLETNQFHKVNLVCLSPNHWGVNNVGNKHYFFMLDGCKSPSSIRSFHNENLASDLLEHKKVMEVLGATNMISPADKQLSGLGFNATVNDELIVKLGGNFKRTLKIKFNN